MHGFPKTFIQPPQRIPYKDRIPPADAPLSSFRSGEIQAMNADYRREQQFWRDEHQ